MKNFVFFLLVLVFVFGFLVLSEGQDQDPMYAQQLSQTLWLLPMSSS